MSQRDDFVATAEAEIGKLQYGFNDRCGWSVGETDCSGLVSGAAQRVGCSVGDGCPNSSALARRCHDFPRPAWMNEQFGPDSWTGSYTQGTGISQAQARATKGAVKFHGRDQGRDGDGPTGHAGISRGDGSSVEALSHALDLRIWHFDDDETTYCALLPGMEGFEPPPPKVPPMYDPPLQIVAELQNPQGGRWQARADGTVRFIYPNGSVREGGMISPADRTHFAGRKVAKLLLRWYKPKGALRRKAGYTILTQSGEMYVPTS